MQRFRQDLRHALRVLSKHPTFTLLAVLALAIGIGANTLIYSLVDTLVLNPFVYPEPDRLVGIGTAFPKTNQEMSFIEILSAPEYADVRDNISTLEHVSALDLGHRHISRPGAGASERLFTAFWWGDPFQTFAMLPAQGRGFLPQEVQSREPVAVISYRVWQNQFGGREELLGDTILVDGEPYTVVGVMPPRLLFLGTDLWLPMWADPQVLPRNRRQFEIVARLKPDATLSQTNAALENLARGIEAEYGSAFNEYEGWSLQARPWGDVLLGSTRPAAYLLLGAVGFVLLLVCSNVANLQLVRSAARKRELAVRAALGAGKGHLIRQLMTESLVLAVVGGVVGIVCAVAGLRLLAHSLPANIVPPGADVAVNGRILLFSLVVTLLAAVFFGIVPALQSASGGTQSTLNAATSRASQNQAVRRLHSSLVAVEVALALVLLVGAGLLMNSFLRLQRVDPGFETSNLLTMRLTLPRTRYQGEQVPEFFQRLVDRLNSLPGVERGAAVSQFPPNVFFRRTIWIEGTEPSSEGGLPTPYLTLVSPEYFETMGISRVQGRDFNPFDLRDGPPVAVINQAAAERYFPNQDALGKRFKIGAADSEGPFWEVIGIVGSTRNTGLQNSPEPEIFAPLARVPEWNQHFLVLRTADNPSGLLPGIRSELRQMDPDQPVYAIQTVEESFANNTATERLATYLLLLFGVMALILAAVGIYGVVSYAVSRRTQEIGVRIALGADSSEVRRLVVRQSLLPVAAGGLIGAAFALLLGTMMEREPFLSRLLYQVSGHDPLTLLVCLLVLGTAAGLASYLPARRASRVDPAVALRYE